MWWRGGIILYRERCALDAVKVWAKVFGQLPLEKAVIIDLHFACGESLPQIAERLEVSVAHVRRSLAEALDVLKSDPELFVAHIADGVGPAEERDDLN
jgi:hypothetical protein